MQQYWLGQRNRVKLKTNLKIASAGLAVVCSGLFVFAVVHSKSYNPETRPQLTQQAVASKLYHQPIERKASTPTTVLRPKTPSADSIAQPPTSTTPLPNTGAGNTVVTFLVVTVVGTATAYTFALLKRTRD